MTGALLCPSLIQIKTMPSRHQGEDVVSDDSEERVFLSSEQDVGMQTQGRARNMSNLN